MWTGVTAITHSSLRRQYFNGIKGLTSTYSKTTGESTRRLTLELNFGSRPTAELLALVMGRSQTVLVAYANTSGIHT